jgi:7-carboxy-7-deazaguanine synthase
LLKLGISASSHFKYVLQNEADFKEVQNLAKEYDLVAGKIILMPEAGNRSEHTEKSKWLAELCKSQGYMFSTRLHVLLWGNERGK